MSDGASPFRPRIPTTVVTGALGAGKTTLLNHVLQSAPDRRIGVLVNDFGDSDIEPHLVVGRAEGVTSLQNGCICCTLRRGVGPAVVEVLGRGHPEHLWVEASGASDPGALAQLFLELQSLGQLRVDGLITVADSETFPTRNLGKHPEVRDRILGADLLVLNKTDLVDASRLEAIERSIRARVPEARVVRAQKGRVLPEVVLGLQRPADRPPPPSSSSPDGHGFASAVVRFESPVTIDTLRRALHAIPPSIVRSKGIFMKPDGTWWVVHGVGQRISVERSPNPGSDFGELVLIGRAGEFDPDELGRAIQFEIRQPNDRKARKPFDD